MELLLASLLKPLILLNGLIKRRISNVVDYYLKPKRFSIGVDDDGDLTVTDLFR